MMFSKSLGTKLGRYGLLGVSSLALSIPAMAAGGADSWLAEEIVVTARKREETLLNVPISLSVVSAASIERSGVKDLEGLSRNVPGVLVEQGAEQESKRFIIRGINAASATSSTVAVYIDDVPVTVGPDSPDLKLFDVSQIEVLRGPQGTLFGASSMGGAIRYISPKTDYKEFSGSAKVEIGSVDSGGMSYEAQGAVGGPLVDGKVAFRASSFYRRDGGYIDIVDETTGDVTEKNTNSSDTYGGRFLISANVTDNVEAIVSLLYQDEDRNGMPHFFTGRGVTTTVPLDAFQRTERVNAGSRDKFFLPNLTLKGNFGAVNAVSSTSYSRRKFDITADFSAFVQNALGMPDPFGTPLVVSGDTTRTLETFTQEVRLSSANDGAFQWVIGGFYSHTKGNRTQDVVTPNLAAIFPPAAGMLLPGGGMFVLDTTRKSEQLAGFGEITYTPVEKLEIAAGVRISEVKIDFDREADGVFNGGYTFTAGKSKESPVTPKFSVSYHATDNVMIYTTAAKGFREGGTNPAIPIGIPACAAALAALGLSDVPDSYGSDNLWSYEVGGKFRNADGTFQANLAAYRIDWSKIQQSIGLAGCGFGFTDNLGKARSEGIEAEVTMRAFDSLTVNLNLGVTKARLTEDFISGASAGGPIIGAPSGTRLPYVPRWTGGAVVQYDFRLGDDLDAYIRGQFQHIGKTTRDLGTPSDNPLSHNRKSYEVASLRVAVAKNRYEVAAFADNLFNAHPTLFETFQEFAPGTASERTTLRPRVIGVSLSAQF